ncbi:hypothetical protein ACS5PN_11725 [Roseateles sp. NT4]|uniref:hypothetical protein n=1 Tax=Roseateles sp. NT4 TaxID=3453715 RepID=UPI003EEE3BFE
MTFADDVDSLNHRIAKAETARDAWRATGGQEQYLEACSLVSALTLQLDQLFEERAGMAARLPSPSTDA